ncbi:MAG: hypothetical protein AB4290_07455 [Spirulina sp.]
MKTYKPWEEEHPRNPLPLKSVQPSIKRFRHRDRGTQAGRVKGA